VVCLSCQLLSGYVHQAPVKVLGCTSKVLFAVKLRKRYLIGGNCFVALDACGWLEPGAEQCTCYLARGADDATTIPRMIA